MTVWLRVSRIENSLGGVLDVVWFARLQISPGSLGYAAPGGRFVTVLSAETPQDEMQPNT